MNQQSTFTVQSWNEESFFEQDSNKMVVAKVEQNYSGHIQGSSRLEYVMYYMGAMRATFVGLEVIEGTVDGKSGSFAIRHVGEFKDGAANSQWQVVEQSGTGELSAISGGGSFSAKGREVVTEHSLKIV